MHFIETLHENIQIRYIALHDYLETVGGGTNNYFRDLGIYITFLECLSFSTTFITQI